MHQVLQFFMLLQYFLQHFYFNYLRKNLIPRKKKINNFFFTVLILSFVHLLLIIIVSKVVQIFNIEKGFLLILKTNNYFILLNFIFKYLFFFFLSSIFFFRILKNDGLQICNFLFSFLILFELCLKIADSHRFINWIGDGLDKSIRYLIMFVICLNCSYFFTRITDQIIRSQL